MSFTAVVVSEIFCNFLWRPRSPVEMTGHSPVFGCYITETLGFATFTQHLKCNSFSAANGTRDASTTSGCSVHTTQQQVPHAIDSLTPTKDLVPSFNLMRCHRQGVFVE